MASPPSTMVHSARSRQYAPSDRTEVRRTTSKPLNFNQAMNDFETMFPELDRDVIETVLRANNGVVQSTIDQLLVLQESTLSEAKTQDPELPSYEYSIGGGEEPPPAYNDIWQDVKAPSPTAISMFRNGNGADTAKEGGGRFWNAPLVGKLPDDFLRLELSDTVDSSDNNRKQHPTSLPTTTSEDCMTEEDIERFLEDEKLAMFLQNEEFIKELRRNQEFVSSLEADHRKAVQENNTLNSVPAASGGARPRTQGSLDDAVFKQKLKHMGKSTRKKFGKVAKRFSRSKGSTKILPPIIHGGESTFNLLEEEDDDEEETHGQENRLALDNISEIEDHSEYDGDLETDEETIKRIKNRPRAGRYLPQTPGTNESNVTNEPIVFYSEDNEFTYKTD